jgi:hypothetical protein
MKILKNVGASLLLTAVLAISAFGGETQTPPCVQGETQTPPCAIALGAIDTPGFTSSAPASLARSRVASSETWFAEIAADLFLNFLPLY